MQQNVINKTKKAAKKVMKTLKNDIYNKGLAPENIGLGSRFMEYLAHYNRLIKKATDRSEITEYSERHHIIPKCIGGTNEAKNIVRLTAREHFVAHWLLHRAYPENDGLAYSFYAMAILPGRTNQRYVPSSRAIAEARESVTLGAPGKAVWCFNYNGDFIAEYPSLSEAALTIGCHISSIGHAVEGKHNAAAGGFQWKKAGDTTPLPPAPKPVKVGCEQWLGDKLIATFNSIKEAQDATGIIEISRAMRGVRKTAGGFTWKKSGSNKDFCGTQKTKTTENMEGHRKSNRSNLTPVYGSKIAHYGI